MTNAAVTQNGRGAQDIIQQRGVRKRNNKAVPLNRRAATSATCHVGWVSMNSIVGRTKERDNNNTKPSRGKPEARATGRAAHTNEDVVDGDMEKPHKVPDEAHHRKTNRRGRRNLGKLCERTDEMAEGGGGTAARASSPNRHISMETAQEKQTQGDRGRTMANAAKTYARLDGWATGAAQQMRTRARHCELPPPNTHTQSGPPAAEQNLPGNSAARNGEVPAATALSRAAAAPACKTPHAATPTSQHGNRTPTVRLGAPA